MTDPAVSRLHRDFTDLLAADGKPTDDPAPALTDPSGMARTWPASSPARCPPTRARSSIAANEPTTDDLPSWVEPRRLSPGGP